MAASENGKVAESYAQMGLSVFPLRPGTKAPATKHGCKDATCIIKGMADGWGACGIGIAMGNNNLRNIIALDFDVDESAGKDGLETLRIWEREHGELPETWRCITPRGGMHIYYELPEGAPEYRNSVNEELAVDVRADGGYVVAPPTKLADGREYIWECDCAPDDIELAEADANVRAFIDYVQAGKVAKRGEKFKLPAVIPEGKRHDVLVKQACSMIADEMDEALILSVLKTVNKERCKPPYKDGEVEAIWSDVISRYNPGLSDEAKAAKAAAKGKRGKRGPSAAEREQAARERASKLTIAIIDGTPAVWSPDEKRWHAGYKYVNRAMQGVAGDLSRAKRKELRDDILEMLDSQPAADEHLIAFTNGVLDIHSGDLREMTPEDRILNVIPHGFSWNAKSDTVDKFLDDIACGDAEVRYLLEAVIGLCMLRSSKYAKCPILLGHGANGKSTYIKFARYCIGEENTSALDLNVIGQRFQALGLMGKLANFGDDISNEMMRGDVAAVWKKVVTGDRINSDVKGTDAVEFTPYATLVFSANEMPRLADSTDGAMRRWMPVPFNATFTGDKRDPDLAIKLMTPEAASYMLLRGVMALTTIEREGGVREPVATTKMLEQIRIDNDSVLAWIEDEGIDTAMLDGKPVQAAYDEYSNWCERTGARGYAKRRFGALVTQHLNVEGVVTAIQGTRKKQRVYKCSTKSPKQEVT